MPPGISPDFGSPFDGPPQNISGSEWNHPPGGVGPGSDADLKEKKEYPPPWERGGGGGRKDNDDEWDWTDYDDESDSSITSTIKRNGKVVKRKKGKRSQRLGLRSRSQKERNQTNWDKWGQ